MNQINLNNSELTELTEDDLIALCHLKGFKPNELTNLYLIKNMLTNIDFITENTPFINLKNLYLISNNITDISNIKYLTNLNDLNLSNNKITDISCIKYLKNSLQILDISGLKLDNEKKTVKVLKTLNKLKHLYCYKIFKNYTIEQLKKELPYIENIFI